MPAEFADSIVLDGSLRVTAFGNQVGLQEICNCWSMLQPFLLNTISLLAYPLGSLIPPCRWHSQGCGCRLLQPIGRGKFRRPHRIQSCMCGPLSSTSWSEWRQWCGLQWSHSLRRHAWVHAAPVKQQSSAVQCIIFGMLCAADLCCFKGEAYTQLRRAFRAPTRRPRWLQ